MSRDRPLVFCIGLNHKTAAIALREKAYISKDAIPHTLVSLRSQTSMQEALIISTCNRCELYGVVYTSQFQPRLARSWFQQATGVEAECFDEEKVYLFVDQSAIAHMFRVVASLDSLVVGETQIVGQFKLGIELAREADSLGPILTRLSQDANRISKKVRTETKVGESTVSISHTAIDLARHVFSDLSEHRFGFIGAGEMMQLAATYAGKYQPQEAIFINRTPSHAYDLVDALGFGRVLGFSELQGVLQTVDVVVSSTASQHPIISTAMLEQVMQVRMGRPLFIVDIALPRDVEEEANRIDDLYLFTIDDLTAIVNKNMDRRKEAGYEAEALIQTAVTQAFGWLQLFQFNAPLGAYRDYLEQLVAHEISRSRGMGSAEGATPQAVQGLLTAIAKRLTADVAKAFKSLDSYDERLQFIDFLTMISKAKVHPNGQQTAPDSEYRYTREQVSSMAGHLRTGTSSDQT